MSAKSVLLEPQHLLDPDLEHTLIVVKPDGYARGLTGEILRRIGKGESNKEIAADLGISVKTVETHRARMMESLGCRSANDLLLLAARHQHELE